MSDQQHQPAVPEQPAPAARSGAASAARPRIVRQRGAACPCDEGARAALPHPPGPAGGQDVR